MPYADPEIRKAYLAAYAKKYRARNRDKIAAYGKDYYVCNRDKITRYHARNREKKAARAKARYAVNRDKYRARRRELAYGITFEEFSALRTLQNNCCAICLAPFCKTPHVDHNHKTKAIRGLLCSNCNTGVGMFKDLPGLLRAAAKYLQK